MVSSIDTEAKKYNLKFNFERPKLDTKRLASDALFASNDYRDYLNPLGLGWSVEVSHAGNMGSIPIGITNNNNKGLGKILRSFFLPEFVSPTTIPTMQFFSNS